LLEQDQNTKKVAVAGDATLGVGILFPALS